MAGVALRVTQDADTMRAHLDSAGITGERAVIICDQLRHCGIALLDHVANHQATAHAFVVPGRIEVLGKHTDYAGGRSLLAAAERGFIVVATRRADDVVQVVDAATGESVQCRLDPSTPSEPGWGTYVLTVVRRVARNFPEARTGADIAFVSDLPAASGMSSSSALMVALFLALSAVNDLPADERYGRAIVTDEDLAGYLAAIENGTHFRDLDGDLGVGTQGGSEDHTAMLCARPGRLVEYRFAPVRFEREIAMPAGYRFVIAFSGVRAEKTGAVKDRYNRASALMHAAAARWREATGRDDATVGAALDADPSNVQRLTEVLGDSAELSQRVAHFIAESAEVIPNAGHALASGDVATFGRLVDRSQALAERLLENQIAETARLAAMAREAGADAASAFGAGFGGSVWALMSTARIDDFERRWRLAYEAAFPHRAPGAMFFQTGAGAPVTRVL